MKIKKNDKVIVIKGKDKGKTGTVTLALPKEGKVLISGININKVHQRPRRSNEKGQIVDKSMPIQVSNVMLVDSKTNKGTRVGLKMVDGKKVRFSKKSGNTI
jgi:large subunit ribosomal protein L24